MALFGPKAYCDRMTPTGSYSYQSSNRANGDISRLPGAFDSTPHPYKKS